MKETKNNTQKQTAKKKNGKPITFASIGHYVEDNIPEPKEVEVRGREVISWGEDNNYPRYLQQLVREVPTLQSIINGCVDYVAGDRVEVKSGRVAAIFDSMDITADDYVRLLAENYWRYGGFSHLVTRTKDHTDIARLECLDLRFVRSDKENTKFFFSERFGEKYVHDDKMVVYPKFMSEGEHDASVLYVKNTSSQTYPAPVYSSAVKACEMERGVDDFHLNALNNGFTASYLVNFNNGEPTPEIQEEIEREFREKFSGHENAARIAFCWNDSRVTATTLEKIDVEDFGEKYESLAKRSRQQIFTAFRAHPNLFGIPTENNGFNAEEFGGAFKLFQRTMISPVQRMIVRSFEKIFGEPGCINIIPFTWDGDEKTE